MIISTIVSTIAPWIVAAPAGLFLSLTSFGIDGGKYAKEWTNEFLGTLLMIFLTFSPGKWWGTQSQNIEWLCHAVAVVIADAVGGGQHVNPMVSVTMFSLGKVSYSEMYSRIGGSMAGGLLAFPLFLKFSESYNLVALGGPAFDGENSSDGDINEAFLNEFLAAFVLMIAIYVLNWELNFGKYHYWIKQFLTAAVIRYCIVMFPSAGPAINPMLGTAWAVFDSGNMPLDAAHYVIYWVASILGGIVSAIVYTIYAGGKVFGHSIPLGPIKDSGSNEKKKKA